MDQTKLDKACEMLAAVRAAGLTVAHLIAVEAVEDALLLEADQPAGVTADDLIGEFLAPYPKEARRAYEELYAD